MNGTIDLAARSSAEHALVDRRTGVITRLVRHAPDPTLPRSWIGVSAHVADTALWGAGRADRYGFGASLGSEARARGAALGEAIERYCGNLEPQDLPFTAFDDLRADGSHAVDPERLCLFSAEQHATPGFPFQPFTRALSVPWCAGTALCDGRPVLVPASLVYLNHQPSADVAPTNPLAYSGIAAGASVGAAQVAAIEELLERDATTIWWASGTHAARIDDIDHILARLDDPALGGSRRLTALSIPSAFPVAVIGAFVEDVDDGVIAFGSACRAEPAEAVEKALVEAYGLLAITRQLADAHSDLWRAVGAGTIPASTYRPFRADRAYRKSFRPDHRDLLDLPAIAQLHLDPSMAGAPLDRLRHPQRHVALADLPAVGGDPLQAYVRMLQEAGMSAVSVDLTTPDVRAAGLTVTRVVVPGLYGNAPPAYPYRGGRRLYEVPVDCGWVDAPLTADRLVTHPLPLA